jgi:hypothetical protein
MEGGIAEDPVRCPDGNVIETVVDHEVGTGQGIGQVVLDVEPCGRPAIRDSSMKVTSTSLSRASRESPSTPLPHPRSITLRALWMGRLSSMKWAPISRLVRENTLAWLWMSMSVPSSSQTVGKGLVRDGRSAAGVQ